MSQRICTEFACFVLTLLCLASGIESMARVPAVDAIVEEVFRSNSPGMCGGVEAGQETIRDGLQMNVNRIFPFAMPVVGFMSLTLIGRAFYQDRDTATAQSPLPTSARATLDVTPPSASDTSHTVAWPLDSHASQAPQGTPTERHSLLRLEAPASGTNSVDEMHAVVPSPQPSLGAVRYLDEIQEPVVPQSVPLCESYESTAYSAQELADRELLESPAISLHAPEAPQVPSPSVEIAASLPVPTPAPPAPVASEDESLTSSLDLSPPVAEEFDEQDRESSELLEVVAPEPEQMSAPEAGVVTKLQPETPVASPIEPAVASASSWKPVDIRELDLSPQLPESQRATATAPREATVEGKQQAETSVQSAFELIQRGATYSARARFVETLRTLAQSLDDANLTSRHAEALQLALQAHKEANDFFPRAAQSDQRLDVESVIGGHSTTILKKLDVANMTPLQCVREYAALCGTRVCEGLGQ